MEVCLVDFETRSYLNVKDVGAWRYAQHETTEILYLGWKLGDKRGLWLSPVLCRILGIEEMPFPQEIIDHIEAGGVFEAHNVQFERAIWKFILHAQMGIPMPTRWKDTLAACAYKAIPLALDKAGDALQLSTVKDPRGKYLLQRLCTPKFGTKSEPDRIYIEDPELLKELGKYCEQDIDAEGKLSEVIGDMPEPEHKLWVLDQIINQRGVRIDVKAVEAALKIIDVYSQRLNNELSDITEGAVTKATQRDKIIFWLKSQDTFIRDLTKDTLEDFLANPNVADKPRRVVEIRQTLARSSTKKLEKMLATISNDARIRGLLQYHGASTGRWAGRLVQPQNFPRGSLEDYCEAIFGYADTENLLATMELLIDTIMIAHDDVNSAIENLEFLFGDPMEAITTSLRGMIIADEGKRFVVSDFSAIEAVVTAWVAGEQWKLDAFQGINEGKGYKGAPDIYCATASGIFHRPVTKADKTGRQIGKVCELAFGYQGGVGAWRNFDKSDNYSDREVNEFKLGWREQHPMTCKLWYGLENAAIATVQYNKPHHYRSIGFEMVRDKAGTWLTIILPNGRRLWYYDPVLEEQETPWGEWRPLLTYEGRDNKKGGSWGRVSTYGGMLTENVVQAISRDIMAEAMIRVERLKYPILLTVHDEIIAEVDENFGSLTEYNQAMSQLPIWIPECPVGVAGWVGTRYMKG